jgi:hypothetical protein
MTPQLTTLIIGIATALVIGGAVYLQARTYNVTTLEELASKLTAVRIEDLNGNFFVCFVAVSAIIRNAAWTYGFVRTYSHSDPECLSIADALRRETFALCAYRRILCGVAIRALLSRQRLPYTDALAEHYIELKQLMLELAQEMKRGDLVLRLERAL